jgi:hypothetical protein
MPKRNYKNYPKDYPRVEPYYPYGDNFGGIDHVIESEPYERTQGRMRQARMKFIDKLPGGSKAVDAYLKLEELQKKAYQKMNKKLRGETDIPKIVPIRTLKKIK